jgi:exonuclease III
MQNNNLELKICFWNARSIRNKAIETFEFFEKNNIQIALLSETWLSISDKISFPGYKTVRKDRDNRRGGGVAIIIRDDVDFSITSIPQLKVIEAIQISVKIDDQILLVTAVYFPGSARAQVVSDFKDDIRSLTNVRSNYIICGDLNARHRSWNCSKANKAGKILLEESLGRFIINFSHSPTYYPESSRMHPSTIDLMITNGLNSFSTLTAVNDLSLDHRPVIFEINCNEITPCRKISTKVIL